MEHWKKVLAGLIAIAAGAIYITHSHAAALRLEGIVVDAQTRDVECAVDSQENRDPDGERVSAGAVVNARITHCFITRR